MSLAANTKTLAERIAEEFNKIQSLFGTRRLPFIEKVKPKYIKKNRTKDIILEGFYLDTTTDVNIVGQTVNSFIVVSPAELCVNVSAGSVKGFYDITVTTLDGDNISPAQLQIK